MASKLVIGFETNCVADLNKLLIDGMFSTSTFNLAGCDELHFSSYNCSTRRAFRFRLRTAGMCAVNISTLAKDLRPVIDYFQIGSNQFPTAVILILKLNNIMHFSLQ